MQHNEMTTKLTTVNPIVTDGYGRDRPTGLGTCQNQGCLSYTRECAAKTGKSNLLDPLRGTSTKRTLNRLIVLEQKRSRSKDVRLLSSTPSKGVRTMAIFLSKPIKRSADSEQPSWILQRRFIAHNSPLPVPSASDKLGSKFPFRARARSMNG